MNEYSYDLTSYLKQIKHLSVDDVNQRLIVMGEQAHFRRSEPAAFSAYCSHRIAILEYLMGYEMLVKLKSEDGQFPFLCSPEDYPTNKEMAKALHMPVLHLEEQLSILQVQGFVEHYDTHTVANTFFAHGQDPYLAPFATINMVVREVLATMSAKERHDLFVKAIYNLSVISTKQR